MRKMELACERVRAQGGEGLEMHEECMGGFSLHTLDVAEGVAGLVRGRYATLHFPAVWLLTPEEGEALVDCLSRILEREAARLLGTWDFTGKRVLVAGLGNRRITADALGPQALSRIHPTADFFARDLRAAESLSCARLFCFPLGTAGETGQAGGKTLAALVAHLSPDLVLLIDALAARSYERLCSTVQLTDTGISPGAGVGEAAQISADDFPCPLLALGAPTVTDAHSLLTDLLGGAEQEMDTAHGERAEGWRGCFLSPQQIDTAIERLATLLGEAVNRVFGVPSLFRDFLS